MTYGPLFNKPTITSIDGVADAPNTQLLADNTDTAFSTVSDIIGNTNGASSSINETKNNSLGASLGNIEDFSPEEPFNISFSNYTDTFSDISRKEFKLSLIPNLANTITLNTPSDLAITWNRVSTIQNLANIGDYVVDGKSLIFLKQPTGQFTINYTGKYPQHEGGLYDGYMPNIYPSPDLVSAYPGTKPVVLQLNPTRYRVTFIQGPQNNRLETFGANLALTFNPVLQPYVSNSGSLDAPLDFVSIWAKTTTGPSSFTKLNCSHIYLISNTEVEFVTTTVFDFTNDIVLLLISNISVGTILKSINSLLFQHVHDRYGTTQQISHNNLRDLLPVSGQTGVTYGGSIVAGSDHPQYLNREGYNAADRGTYGNAMLGDLVLASTDVTSSFINILADSNRLVFGSPSNGAAIKYSSSLSGPLLFAATNGLAIQSLQTNIAGKQSYSLSLNGHQFFNYNISGTSYLNIGSSSAKIRFSDNIGTTLADIYANSVNVSNASINSVLTIENTGSLSIGDISFVKTPVIGQTGIQITSVDNTAFVNFQVPASFVSSTHTLADIVTAKIETTLNLFDAAKITFGTSSPNQAANYLSIISLTNNVITTPVTENSVSLTLAHPLRLFNTGRRTGISFGDTISDEYATFYTSTPDGSSSSPSVSDTYFELHSGALYLLQTTNRDLAVNGSVFKWKAGISGERVDSLKLWPRSDIYAGQGNFNSIKVDLSTISEKEGISFGANNTIYVTGSFTGSSCPSGWMVLESQNGVVLIDASANVLDCAALNYSSLTSGEIQAHGSIIASIDISAGGNIRSAGSLIGSTLQISGASLISGDTRIQGTLTLEKDLVSLAGGTFNTNLTIKGSLIVNNAINANILTTSGIATFNEIVRANADVFAAQDVFIAGNTSIGQTLVVSGKTTLGPVIADNIIVNALTVSGQFIANSGMTLNGNLDVSGNANIGQILVAHNGIYSDSVLSGVTLQITGISSFGDTTTFNGDVNLRKNVNLSDASSLLTVAGSAQFSGATTINGTLHAFGDSVFSGNITVNAIANFKSAINVDGLATFSSAVNIAGLVNAQSLNVTNTATIVGLLISESKIQGVDIELSGNLIVAGNITGSTLTVINGIVAGNTSTSNFGNVNVAGSFNQTSAIQQFNISGPSSFSNTVAFGNNASVAATLTIGNANKVIISDNNIQIGPLVSGGNLTTGSILANSIVSQNLTTNGTNIIGGTLAVSAPTTFTGGVSVGGNRVTNGANPTSPQDLATKFYVDSSIIQTAPQIPKFGVAIPITGITSSFQAFDVSSYGSIYGVAAPVVAIVYIQIEAGATFLQIFANPIGVSGSGFPLGGTTSGQGGYTHIAGFQALVPVVKNGSTYNIYIRSDVQVDTFEIVGMI
jgi:hypothetical protein